MSDTYIDTGILLKLYTAEPESRRVQRWIVKANQGILFTDLHFTECIGALRQKQFRGECSEDQASRAIQLIRDDIRNRVLRPVELDWPQVWTTTRLLVQLHTGTCGARTLDALHVAAAQELNIKIFATSDSRQTALARACSLYVINPATG